MDDKKLDKIMQDYLSTTVKGKDADFGKIDAKSFTKKSNTFNSKTFICIATILVAVIAVISIVLPIALKGNSGAEDKMFFADDGSIEYIFDNDKDVVFNNLKNMIVPTVQCDNYLYSTIKSTENNDIIGVTADFGIYDEIYDDISMHILKNGYMIDILGEYLKLENVIVWREYSIHYDIKYNANISQYDFKIYFKDCNYNYFISAVYYESIDIGFILDTIYE